MGDSVPFGTNDLVWDMALLPSHSSVDQSQTEEEHTVEAC